MNAEAPNAAFVAKNLVPAKARVPAAPSEGTSRGMPRLDATPAPSADRWLEAERPISEQLPAPPARSPASGPSAPGIDESDVYADRE
jgi:hypothetical protein